MSKELSPQDHLELAEECIKLASDRQNDASWALVEAQLAQAHLMAAAVKVTVEKFGSNKASMGVLSLVSKMAR